MFCPKCGSILLPKKVEEKKKKKVEKGAKKTRATLKKVMACPKCTFVEETTENAVLTEEIKSKAEIEVVDENDKLMHLPLDKEAQCEKCGHKGAHYELRQTRASDEPETKIYTCPECNFSWRDYD